jgi:hypothetical protein
MTPFDDSRPRRVSDGLRGGTEGWSHSDPEGAFLSTIAFSHGGSPTVV